MLTLFQSALTLDTSAYTDLDTLADLVEITRAARGGANAVKLVSVEILDKDDQGIGLDLLFFGATVVLDAKNAAWALSDTLMAGCQGMVQVASADFIDLGGNRVATKRDLGLVLRPDSGTSLFLATRVNGGTPTYTASGLRVTLGFERLEH